MKRTELKSLIQEIIFTVDKPSIKIKPDFFNNLASEIDKKYFKDVKYYRDNKDDADVHYAIELFNNGALAYPKLIDKLAKSCKDTKQNIHKIVSKYVIFNNYEYK